MTEATDRLLALFRLFLDGFDSEIVRSFLDPVDWSMARRQLEPNALPCMVYLDRIAALAPTPAVALVEHVASRSHDFGWGQTYTSADFGPAFMSRYGWLEVFGTRGHFVNDRIAAGLLLLGTHVEYPDHHHVAEEVYIPLTSGTEWRKDDGSYEVRQAGDVIHHPSEVSHAMSTGDRPLLALYLWRGGPLAQKSVIGMATGKS